MTDAQLKEWVDLLMEAVDRLYKNDPDLLKLKCESDQCEFARCEFAQCVSTDCEKRSGMERMCAFRIGHYFCNLVSSKDGIRDEGNNRKYNIDMEYGKDVKYNKVIDNRKVRPDLIVHKRGHNNNNLLVVEFKYLDPKEDWNGHKLENLIDWDVRKLMVFTRQDVCNEFTEQDVRNGITEPNKIYKYKMGLLVILKERFKDVKYRYFRDGVEVEVDEN
jgi:hypothetical protein